MSYRDVFRVAIRLFGLASILYSLFTFIPQLYYYIKTEDGLITAGFALASIALFIFYYFLILKSDSIIDALRLDKGYEKEELPLSSFSNKGLLALGIILIGCYTCIRALPDLLIESFVWFSQRVREDGSGILSFLEAKRETYVAENFVQVLIGYLLMTNFDRVANWLSPKKESVG